MIFIDVGQLGGAAQLHGDGLKPVDCLAEVVRDELLVALGVEDDDGVQAVAGGTPFVFLDMPGRHGGDGAAVVQRGGELVDEALRQGGDGADFLEGGQAVADAHLDGAEVGDGPDVPADFGEGVDHAGGEHVLDVGLVVLPAGELEGQAGGGQLLEHQRALGGVAGVFAAPERAGGGERLEVREVVHQAVQDGEDLVAAVEADVHVDAVDDHLAAPPLGAVNELGVAGLVRHGLQLRRAEGVASGAEDLDAHGIGDVTDRREGTAQVRFGLGHGVADPGDQLHRVQQQLLLDVRVLVVLIQLGMPGGHTAEDLVGHRGQLPGFRVDQGEFPFHTKS